MKKLLATMAITLGSLTAVWCLFPSPSEAAGPCPVNHSKVGSGCIYTHEASVWSEPPAGNIPRGVQYGLDADDYPCQNNGNDCTEFPIYAASLPGQKPSRYITWFQAAQACAMSGAQLPSNALWQTAAAGTPEVDCNVGPAPGDTTPTGSNGSCTSTWGAHDMVGNVWEWVQDWAQSRGGGEGSTNTGPNFGNDVIFGIGQHGTENQGTGSAFPLAWVRGGGFTQQSGAGIFALFGRIGPARAVDDVGFRCAK